MKKCEGAAIFDGLGIPAHDGRRTKACAKREEPPTRKMPWLEMSLHRFPAAVHSLRSMWPAAWRPDQSETDVSTRLLVESGKSLGQLLKT